MRLTVLCTRGRSTNILLNWLQDNGFTDIQAIRENRVPRRMVLRNRLRKLGFWKTFGQAAFQTIIPPILRSLSQKRNLEIMKNYGLRSDDPKYISEVDVSSVNGGDTLEFLKSRNPDIILVSGTRIIRNHILKNLECPIVNIHAGITPDYRGVHGGYWALWNGDAENFGVTLHLVDEGVDSGQVLAQARLKPTVKDNFSTYPLLQQAVGLTKLKALLSDINALKPAQSFPLASYTKVGRLWYHPTLRQYLAGLRRGVR